MTVTAREIRPTPPPGPPIRKTDPTDTVDPPWIEWVLDIRYRVLSCIVAAFTALLQLLIIGFFRDWTVSPFILVLVAATTCALVIWFSEFLRLQSSEAHQHRKAPATDVRPYLRIEGRDDTKTESASGRRNNQFLLRLGDLGLAIFAIILVAPVFVVIAFAVKLSSPGPVFCKKTYVGIDRRRTKQRPLHEERRRIDYGGRLYEVWMFRTTYKSSTASEMPHRRAFDERVTKLGRALRRYRLDELPELFNVLKGDMSFVGPRPQRLDTFLRLREQLEGYPERQRVRPGMTGLAGLNDGTEISNDDLRTQMKIDLEYARRPSVRRYLRILGRAFRDAFHGESF